MSTLVLLPQITATPFANGSIGITEKFLTGVEAYVERWHGTVRVVVEPSPSLSHNLDNVSVQPAELPFELVVCNFKSRDLIQHIKSAAVALGGMDYRQNHLPFLCRELNVPFVNTSEYTLKTRKQIIDASVTNPIIKLRKYWWEHGQEKANIRAIRESAGIQCNGMPTYLAYKSISKKPLLYFDSRVASSDLITAEQLTLRINSLEQMNPLRLVFSGRLDPMKGVNYLVPIAKELKIRGVPFVLSIYGDGTLKNDIERSIKLEKLDAEIKLIGSLDFKRELLPAIKKSADLFVCPHIQGDPSCTYLETLSCGVPIVGFNNESLSALTTMTDAVWATPLKKAYAVADKIMALHNQRETIKKASYSAVEFAKNHTMEVTFDRRIDHLKAISTFSETALNNTR